MEKILRIKLVKGKFTSVSKVRSKTMAAIKGKGNKSTEVRLRLAFVRIGLRGWAMHEKTIIGKPDFFFYNQRLAIFVDGCFWHGCPLCGHIPKTNSSFWKTKIKLNKIRDRNTKKRLKAEGINVLRIWEHDIRENINSLLKTVIKNLNAPSKQSISLKK